MQAGLSGAIAIHAIYTLDETVLFFERPHVGAANSGVVPNPYLTVSGYFGHIMLSCHACEPPTWLCLCISCAGIASQQLFVHLTVPVV